MRSGPSQLLEIQHEPVALLAYRGPRRPSIRHAGDPRIDSHQHQKDSWQIPWRHLRKDTIVSSCNLRCRLIFLHSRSILYCVASLRAAAGWWTVFLLSSSPPPLSSPLLNRAFGIAISHRLLWAETISNDPAIKISSSTYFSLCWTDWGSRLGFLPSDFPTHYELCEAWANM